MLLSFSRAQFTIQRHTMYGTLYVWSCDDSSHKLHPDVFQLTAARNIEA